MLTEVMMQRELFGGQISQSSKNGFFSATDLLKLGNKWRIINDLPSFDFNSWLSNKSTKEFIETLKNKYGEVKVNSKGKNSHTMVHPLLFIDIALAISPQLKVEVYEWLYDNLILFRNDSGDSYKEMCNALYGLYPNKREFPFYIANVAENIKKQINVENWQTATEEQLKLRDKIHNAIKLLCNVLRNPNEAVRLGLHEYDTNEL
jgi:hypothetical protein